MVDICTALIIVENEKGEKMKMICQYEKQKQRNKNSGENNLSIFRRKSYKCGEKKVFGWVKTLFRSSLRKTIGGERT